MIEGKYKNWKIYESVLWLNVCLSDGCYWYDDDIIYFIKDILVLLYIMEFVKELNWEYFFFNWFKFVNI